MNDVLKNIEEIRKEKHVKQAVIAEILGIKQPAYSNFINRESDITYSRLLQISNALEVSPVDIITWPEKWVPESQQTHVCENCLEKDKIIQNLNEYIEILKKRK